VSSKNSPGTGLRIMHSVQRHELPITRATAANLPAGRVLESTFTFDDYYKGFPGTPVSGSLSVACRSWPSRWAKPRCRPG